MNNTKIIYQGNFIKILEKIHNGQIYEQAFFLPTVHVFPITKGGNILFIEEERLEYESFRILLPSGVMDVSGEKSEDAAKREMEEEIAYTTQEKLELVTEYEEKGTINSNRYYFLARNVEKMRQEKEPQIRRILEISPEKMFEMTCNGDFGMSKSVLAYLDFYKKIKNGEIKL